MPAAIYEIVALAARFWFLFLMVMIVWRSYRWYARERRLRKKRMKYLPDAGYIGELVLIQSGNGRNVGKAVSVPFEGTLGRARSNDLCIPMDGVDMRHLHFRYDEKRGLALRPMHGNVFSVDDQDADRAGVELYMLHGSRLYLGDCVLRLRMFAGYEVTFAPGCMPPPRTTPPCQSREDVPATDEQEEQDDFVDQPQAARTARPYPPYPSAQPYGNAPVNGNYASGQPTYQQPYMPQAAASVPPAYQQPVQPYMPQAAAPVSPVYQQPVQPYAPQAAANAPPAYQQPVQSYAPQAAATAQPVYQQPAPAYAPQQAAAPAQPVYQQPVPEYAPPQETYDRPAVRQAEPLPTEDTGAEPTAAQWYGDRRWKATRRDDAYREAYANPEPVFHPLVEEEEEVFHPLVEDDDGMAESWDEEPSRRQSRHQRYAPPSTADEEDWPFLSWPEEWRAQGIYDDLEQDEDQTDAAMPPRSAYVGRDESEWARKRFWNKYFGGGGAP